MMMLHERIKYRRIELGYTQDELAQKTGYKSRSAINKIEKGINDITQSKIIEFSKALECTPAYLMGWEDEPKKEIIINDDLTVKLVTVFEQLSILGKEKVIDYTNMVYNSEQKDK